MRVTHTRPNAVTVVATRQELSALVSGARMAHALMSADTDAPPGARELACLLARVIADFDEAVARRSGTADGTAPGPVAWAPCHPRAGRSR